MTLKVAIVGCGAIADGHVEEIGKIDGAEVAAVCDLEIIMAEQLADRYRLAGVYDDYERMLADVRPDVVHITTPPQSHLALATRAMETGAHVYVEKPVALNHADTVTLIERARSHGRKLTAGHIYQFDPPSLELRRLLRNDVLGDVIHVECTYGYNLDGHFGRAIMGSAEHWVHGLPGRLIHNNISHALARVAEFVTDPEPSVHAVAWKQSPVRYGDVRDLVNDELRVIVAGAGVSACVTFSAAARPVAHVARICGTRNTALVNLVTRTVTLERSPRLPSAIGRLLTAFPQGWEFHREGWKNAYRFLRYRYHFQDGMNELFRRFYDSIRDDGDPPIPYTEILSVARIIDEIVAQTETQPGGARR